MSYEAVFAARGGAYDRAMARWPDVRGAELDQIVALAGLVAGEVVADVPSGGGYLSARLPAGVEGVPVELSPDFAARYAARHGAAPRLGSLGALPLADGEVDAVLCLAGLHHEPDRRPFWAEVRRVLRPGGRLVVMDGAEGSPVARFLDGFVDRHTATGHRGVWLGPHDLHDLSASGLVVERAEDVAVPWQAADRPSLLAFVRHLFGLTRGSDDALAAALAPIGGDGGQLDWTLRAIVARRVP